MLPWIIIVLVVSGSYQDETNVKSNDLEYVLG